MKNTGWLNHCIPCKNWCCNDENPYASPEELNILKVDKIRNKKNGSCMFLESGKCSQYDDRPFECRIFPFDILTIDGKLFWIRWKICPGDLTKFKLIEHIRDINYIKKYAKYHESNIPKKYSQSKYDIIKKIE